MNIRGAALGAALCAAGLAAWSPGEALAGPRGDDRRIEMARPQDAPDPDAEGEARVRERRAGDRVTVELRNLESRRRYVVRDAESGDDLGRARMNRRGRGKAKLAGRGGKRGAALDAVGRIEVVDEETGDCVLVGEFEEREFTYSIGAAEYEDDDGDYALVNMASFPDYDSESFYLAFFPEGGIDDKGGVHGYHEYFAETSFGDELPLGVERVADLAGRDFELRDADGNTVLGGTLPELEEFTEDWGDDVIVFPEDDWEDFENWTDWGGSDDGLFVPLDDFDPFRMLFKDGEEPGEEPSDAIRLWIENDSGVLVEAAELTAFDPWWDDEPLPCPCDCGDPSEPPHEGGPDDRFFGLR